MLTARRSRGGQILTLLVLVPPTVVCAANFQSLTAVQSHPTSALVQSCREAAKKALGPEAEVLNCGHLTSTRALETVAVIRLKGFRTTTDGIPVSNLVILRQEESEWSVELTADKKWIRNGAGYVGIDFIDDSADFVGYRVSFSGEGSKETSGFTVGLFYLGPNGHNEGISTDISWNQRVGRFQEYSENKDPSGFQVENKNPPHIRRRKSPR